MLAKALDIFCYQFSSCACLSDRRNGGEWPLPRLPNAIRVKDVNPSQGETSQGYHRASMLEQHIQQHFIDSADLHYQVSQEMSESVANAVYALLACVTSDNKVMCCGSGLSWAQAAQFAAMCVSGMDRERPELAAMVLDNGALAQAQLGSSLPADKTAQVLARQVRTLGQSGDLLFVIGADGHDRGLLGAVQAAHERDMTVVVLTGRKGGPIADALSETDVLMQVPHDRATRVREVHQLVLHCLMDGIDTQLLGEEE